MWSFYLSHALHDRLEWLRTRIEYLARNKENLHNHPDVKLYVGAIRGIKRANEDPTRQEYLLGDTMGKEHRDWRRIKRLLPSRYRMFFKFFTRNNEIFYVWMNDEKTLRENGAKNDCYNYFKRLLDSKKVPSDRAALLSRSVKGDL